MSWTNTNGDTLPGPTEGNDIYIGGDAGTPAGGVNALGGNDSLSGGAGFDLFFGGAGNDTLRGGGGNDTLDGGTDTDTADYSAETAGVTVELFGGGFSFGGTATGATIGNDTLAGIENVIGGAGADSINSFFGSAANRFDGGAGNDVLRGGGGNDTLSGGAGNDNLDGGANTDTADYSDDTAGVTVQLFDVVFFLGGTATGATIGNDTLNGIENVIGGAGADSIVSTEATTANRFEGGAGNDTLRGGGGNDTLRGGAGDDTLDGGAGTDTADYSDDTAGVTVALDDGTATGAAIGTDTLTDIENVIGGAGADSIASTAGTTANRFDGGAGNDTLTGGGGRDTLDGGAGYDIIQGGDDADLITDSAGSGDLIGGAGDDTIAVTLEGASNGFTNRVLGGSGNDLITATGTGMLFGGRVVTTILRGEQDNDTIVASDADDPRTGGDQLSGGIGDDSLLGGLGNNIIDADDTAERSSATAGNDVVDAGAGDDRVVTNGGADTLEGGTGNDQAWIQRFVSTNLGFTVDGAGRLTSTEGLVATGFERFWISSGDGNDTIISGQGNDTLSGGARADIIVGNAGDDQIFGGFGNDTLSGGAGDDRLDGGADTDTADYSDDTAGVTVTLDGGNDGTATGTSIGTDALTDIENVIGGAGADSIASTGGITANRFEGRAGNDTLSGAGGNDTLDGGTDTDTADYSADTAGVTVALDAGDDGTATGTTIGSDILTDIENVIGGAGDDTIASTDGPTANRFEGGAGNDVLRGGGGIDNLLGDGGRDTLEGGAGYDVIRGGDDADLITDTLDGGNLSGEGGDDTIALTLAGTFVGFGNVASGGSGDDLITATGTGTQAVPGRLPGFLYGDEGDDTLVASNANDPIFIGDQLYGGTGDDSLVGSLGINIIEADEAAEKASTSAGTDVVDAGAGDDSVYSFGGADTLEGGIGNDLAFIERAVTTDLGVTIDGAGVLTSTEGLRATGFERFDIRLGAGNDTILGGGGNDQLSGGAGADIIAGNAGDDRASGQAGNDTLSGGAGSDILDGGADTDTADYSGDTAGVSVTLNAGDDGTATGAGIGSDILTDIENVIGGAGNDSIASTAGTTANRFDGGAGRDSLSGGGGNDTLSGGDDNDTLLGGEGDDFVLGGAGDDSIDTGEDDDLVIWRVGDGNDTADGGDGVDKLDLEGWTPGGNADWTFVTSGSDTVFTHVPTGAAITARGFESVACFAPGTRILTASGEVPVETLRAGDLLVAPGRGAPLKPVRWVGHTRVDIARHRDKRKVAPVLIRAGAFGTGVPARDLRVSPEHAVLLQGRLVPAHLLLNGTTIVQEMWHRTITYWHVELDEHGVLVAEGALAESYFDDGNRHLFDNAVLALHVDFGAGREGGRYATTAFVPPITSADDPALARIRAALPAAPAMARSG